MCVCVCALRRDAGTRDTLLLLLPPRDSSHLTRKTRHVLFLSSLSISSMDFYKQTQCDLSAACSTSTSPSCPWSSASRCLPGQQGSDPRRQSATPPCLRLAELAHFAHGVNGCRCKQGGGGLALNYSLFKKAGEGEQLLWETHGEIVPRVELHCLSSFVHLLTHSTDM